MIKKRRCGIFLGGYINTTNAQNLNCLALAKHLNKNKFSVYSLKLYAGDLASNKLKNVHIFTCFYPHKISKYLGYLWGIWKSDVSFLPKGEVCLWNKFWVKLLRKKCFFTIEGATTKANNLPCKLAWFDKVYPISHFIRESELKYNNFKVENTVLYLGVEYNQFNNEHVREKNIKTLSDIAFVGRIMSRKGLYDLMKIAENFTSINFHIFGRGNGDKDESDIKSAINKISNMKMYGVLPHKTLSEHLTKCQLHVFPSRIEGFPKVILETAACGVPSLVYPDYGANEWISHGNNGFVVNTIDEMIEQIRDLQNNASKLQMASENSIKMAEDFDWKKLVITWEKEIEKLCV